MIQAAFLMTVVDMVSLHPDQWSDRKGIFTWSEEMAEPGPRNLITDVPGLLVGQAEDPAAMTGTTVVWCETPAVASVDVRGGAPGTRETDLLGQATLVDRIDAAVLSGEIDAQPLPPDTMLDAEDFSACAPSAAGANTTIAVVATDMALDKAGCHRLAMMAQDGLAQAIRPAHTPFDGDTVFALSMGSGSLASADQLTRLGAAVASCLARAIMRALTEAEPLGGFPSWRQRWGAATV